MILISDSLSVPVCNRDGGQVRPVAFSGGGCRSGQSGAAQPAGGGEEVGDQTFPAAVMMGAEMPWDSFGELRQKGKPDDSLSLTEK